MKDATEVAVLSCLASHANDDGESCFAGIPRIAKLVRRSERTVQRTLDALEAAGWLTVLRGDGAGNFTRYEISVEQLKGCQDVTLLRKAKRVTLAQERVTLTTQKGDIGDTLILKGNVSETKANGTPPRPLASEGGRGLKNALNYAVDQVCSALAVTNRRKHKLLRDVIALEAEKGDPPATIALAMIAAWNAQAVNSPVLRVKLGLARFFGEGIWKDGRRWHWDEEQLRRNGQASVGSGR